MRILFHQQMNIISAIVLLLFWMYACSALDRKSNISKIYIYSVALNFLLITLDVAFYFIISIEGVSVFLPRIIGSVIFMLSPLLPYSFLKFVCFYFPNPFKMKKSTKTAFAVLLILNFIVSIFTFKSKMFVESINITEYIVPFLISVIFLVYSGFVIFYNKKMLIDFEYVYMITIILITTALVLIQLFAKETRFIWCSSTFTLMLMFIVIQQRELYRDTLTGARNRLVLNKCLDAFVKKSVGNLSVVMIDLDYFKNINDYYGHSEGDSALKMFVKLLKKVYSDNCIIIRMGGDEFLILIYEISTAEVDELMNKMSNIVDKFNNKGTKPYNLKYSCAFGNYENDDMNIYQFIHKIDMQMYKNKNVKRGSNINNKEIIFSVENM